MDKVLTQIKNLLGDDKYNDCRLKMDISTIITQNEKLNFKTIKELKGLQFNIPSYQRGYRWKVQQVEDLLNDINGYANQQGAKKADFYCLQPIVVMKNGDKWDVIDGQQRLTTIFLILKYLNKNKLYSVEYETRDESFLNDITSKKEAAIENIDEFHFIQAYQTIEEWFNCRKNEIKRWYNSLLEETQIIWYKVDNEENGKALKSSIDAFMRLNSGKIPLTNSEMIRALFLINCVDENDSAEMKLSKQQKLAVEWDNLERELQNDDFWGFITLGEPFGKKIEKNDYPNRIEFIFDLIEGGTNKDHQDKYSTYRRYEHLINSENKSVEDLWLEVKQYYWRFHEWYIDNELYHLIGYCRLVGLWELKGRGGSGLLAYADDNTQTALIDELKRKIGAMLKGYFQCENSEKVLLEKLQYGEDNQKIQNILKLFNVYTHIQENTRCPFELYAKIQWSLEHIHAQNSQELDNEKWKEWAVSIIKKYNLNVKDDKLIKDILSDWNKNDNKSETKIKFENKIAELFGDIKDYMHTLMNMALLGKSANSALGNMIFPQKRIAVLSFITDEKYSVPIATKNVFLKYYSSDIGEMKKWSISDCKAYGEALISCFNKFGISNLTMNKEDNTNE